MWSLIPSRSARRAAPIRPSRTLFFCLVGTFLLSLFPQIQKLPFWVIIAVILGMTFRAIGEVRRWLLPSSTFCGVMAISLFAAVYLQFGTIFGRDAGTAFMASLLTVKFFELRSSRDIALIIFCSFFVVMSSLLYSQDVELFIYCLIMMWVLTALLLRASAGDLPEDRLLRLLGTSGFVFLQALPLTLFLFVFFPRYHGVLMLGSDTTSIGLTDRVEPGSIARLANDDSTAMTVKMTSPGIISPGTLYWRGLVLWNYAHDIWSVGDPLELATKPKDALPRAAPGSSIDVQEITIYPHFHRWLFALDYPVGLADSSDGIPGWSEASSGGVLSLTGSTVNHKERYTVASSSLLAPQDLSPELKLAALQLPKEKDDSIDPRVKALAAKLQEGCRNEDDYIRAVLFYFRHQHFIYSTSPGAKGKDALANFLLKSKIGFCEHFSSAFAVLMRLGNVPTRMVVGYQGAQVNPYNHIFVVKQSNAHSWDEVWIASEKYWRRVDPTAILSASETLAGPGERAGTFSIDVAGHPYTLISDSLVPTWVRQTMLEAQLRRQEVEADWNDWIFSYDPQVQNRIALALGVHHQRRTFGLLSLAAFAACGAILALAMKRRVKVSPVEAFYARFCRGMAQRGAPRAPWEGPLAYTGRMAEAFPEKKRDLAEVGRIVADTRYAPEPPAISHGELNSLLLSITASRAASSPPHEG